MGCFGFSVLQESLGAAIVTVALGGIDEVIKTFPPMMAPLPITVSVPRIVAPEYMMTSSSMVGWRFLPLSIKISLVDSHVVSDFGGFACDDAGSVVDEVFPDFCAWCVCLFQLVSGRVRSSSEVSWALYFRRLVSNTVSGDSVDAPVAQNDFFKAFCCWVAFVRGVNVSRKASLYFREAFEKIFSDFLCSFSAYVHGALVFFEASVFQALGYLFFKADVQGMHRAAQKVLAVRFRE